MAYDPPNGSNIILEFSGEYTPPDGGNIHLGNIAPPPQPIPQTPDFSVPWGQYPTVNRGTSPGWTERRPVNASIGMGWIKRLARDAVRISSIWVEKAAKDNDRDMAWSRPALHPESNTVSNWRNKPANDHLKTSSWKTPRIIQISKGNRSLSPPANERLVTLAYSAPSPLDIGVFSVPWGNPPPKDRWHRTL